MASCVVDLRALGKWTVPIIMISYRMTSANHNIANYYGKSAKLGMRENLFYNYDEDRHNV